MATKKQIMFPIGLLLAGIGIAAGLSALKKPPEKKEAKEVIPLVQVESINIKDVTLNVNSYGIVAPKNKTQLVAQVNGQVVNISEEFVNGSFVKQGDILARIDPNDYEAALTEAQASLAQARSSLEIERAQAHVAQSEWERIRKNSSEFIPSELYLRKPQLAEKLAQFRATEAAVKRANRNLERTYIKAPYDAIIVAREISLGSVVNQGSILGQLNSINLAEIRLPVADKELRFLQNGGVNAKVMLTTKFAGTMQNWAAKIVRSEGVINAKSRMSYLVAQVEDPYALASDKAPLRFGAYVNASIEGIQISDATYVARHLVKNNKIALLDNNGTLTFKPVTVIREQGDQVLINEGLIQDQQVITTALDFPSEGMKLHTAETAPKPEEKEAIDDTQLAMKKD